MKIKLNIGSIVRFEQISNKPFTTIDLSNIDDVNILLYCSVISNNDYRLIYTDFMNVMNQSKKLYTKLTTELIKEFKFIEQFSDKNKINEINSDEPDTTDTQFIKDSIFRLLMNSSLNVKWILDDMSFTDLQCLIMAYDDKIKSDMERDRLWTYISVLPHIDSKKINSPDKLFIFPWEKSESEIDYEISSDEIDELFKNAEVFLNKKEL